MQSAQVQRSWGRGDIRVNGGAVSRVGRGQIKEGLEELEDQGPWGPGRARDGDRMTSWERGCWREPRESQEASLGRAHGTQGLGRGCPGGSRP